MAGIIIFLPTMFKGSPPISFPASAVCSLEDSHSDWGEMGVVWISSSLMTEDVELLVYIFTDH